MSKKRITAYILLITAAALWGFGGPIIKITLSSITPFSFLFWRLFLVSIIFLPFFIRSYIKEQESLSSLIPIIPIGFIGIPLCLSLIFLGFDRTTALDGSVLAIIDPIFIVIAGAILLKERVTLRENIGLCIAIIGTLFLVIQPILSNGALAAENLFGNVLIILGNLSWVVYVILCKKQCKTHSPFIITSVSFFVGVITIFPLALLEKGTQLLNFQSTVLDSGAFWGIIYMVLFASIVSFLIFEFGLKLIEASEASLFIYLQPIFAAPLAVFWLGESLSFYFVLGAIVIAIGVVMTEYRGPKLHF